MFYKIVLCLSGLLLLSSCASFEDKKDPRCLQKPDTGLCRAYFEHYYFDNRQNQCKVFIWGGCAGSVPFKTKEACTNICLKSE